MSCIQEWLGHNPNWETVLEGKTMMLAHHNRRMGNNPALIFSQVVYGNPEWLIEAQAEITVCMNVMGDMRVQIAGCLGNISYCTLGQETRNADTSGGWGSRGPKSVSLYVFPLVLCYSFEVMSCIWVYGFL